MELQLLVPLVVVALIGVSQLARIEVNWIANVLDQQMQNQTNELDQFQIQSIFSNWISIHRQQYMSTEEESYRFGIFKQQLQEIQIHNQNLNQNYSQGLNQFSDITFEELQSLYLTLNPSKNTRQPELIVTAAPEEFDWSTQGAVTQVLDQGKCGSCWSFSATGALEGFWFLKSQQLVQLSKQQLMDCSSKFGNRGCAGGWMDWAFDYVWDNKIMSQADYPYLGKDSSCMYDQKQGLFQINGYKYVQHNDLDQLVLAISNNVVSVSIAVANDLFDYTSGVYDGACADLVNHGVLAVGYGKDQKSGLQYWQIKNSWGPAWGEDGYFRMKRERGVGTGHCSIGTQPVYPA